MSWDFGQALSALTWGHLTRGVDVAFLFVFATYGVGGSPGDVSKETSSGGDKASRSMGKSQLERQKAAEKPSLEGSWAQQRREEEGLWVPPLCSLKYISWERMSTGRRGKLEPNNQ